MNQSTFPLILFRAQQVSFFLEKLGNPREIQKYKNLKKKKEKQGGTLRFQEPGWL